MFLSRWLRPERALAWEQNQAELRQTVVSFKPTLLDGTSRDLHARCEEQAARLRFRLAPHCTVRVYEPLVMASDLPEGELAAWYQETIEPGMQTLRNMYFAAPAEEPITVVLCASTESYQHWGRTLFGEDGATVYGYYKRPQRTVISNASTGRGTLLHELTHALFDCDFPQVPDWFNEGLASLNEEVRMHADGRALEGLPNWRLPILQRAIQQERLATIQQLVEGDFRGGDEAVRYAHARYLCLYLQHRGVLREYYAQFRSRQPIDPQGIATLQAVLGRREWDEIETEFRAWAMSLAWTPNDGPLGPSAAR
jgi:hypothetical protein